MKREFPIQITKEREPILRGFVIQNADTLRLTRIYWRHLLLPHKTIGSDKDPKFIKLIELLKNDFIKKEISNKKFNDIEQGKRKKFEHYFYKLSPRIIKMLNRETLLFKNPHDTLLRGFEDPTFYKDDKMLASIISHENTASLYLSKPQINSLKQSGLDISV